MLDQIQKETRIAVTELLQEAGLSPGDILVVGCSSSEIKGDRIGSASSPEIGKAVCEEIAAALDKTGVFLAAQCCEHLNRVIILEKEAALRYGLPPVNAVPQPKAGGSFATAAYAYMKEPVAVEHIQAQAGMDIGGTLIGMHLRPVAVPLRLSIRKIGEAVLTCARTRPKFIGGERTCYDDRLR